MYNIFKNKSLKEVKAELLNLESKLLSKIIIVDENIKTYRNERINE